jgi:hypothetical protein
VQCVEDQVADHAGGVVAFGPALQRTLRGGGAHELADVLVGHWFAQALHQERQVLREIAGLLVALCAITGQRLVQHVDRVISHVAADLSHVRDHGGLYLLERLDIAFAQEQSPPCQHFPEQDACGKDIDAAIGTLPERHFRREVAEFAFDDVLFFRRKVRAGFGQAEVNQLDLAEARHQHIVR